MKTSAAKRPLVYDLPLVATEVVDGWNIRQVHDLAEVVGGATPDTSKPEFWQPPEIPWATPTDITACDGIRIASTERGLSKLGLENCSTRVLPASSCLMTSRATVGECRINTVPMATNQGFASLIPKQETDPLFLYFLTAHIKPAAVRLAAGTTYVEVSRREIRRIRCRVPQRPEQERMVALLLQADQALEAKKGEIRAAWRLKTALMQQLFTRGIPGRHNRFIKTKWIHAPSGWDVVPLRQIAEIVSGFTMGRDLSGHDVVSLPYLTVINVQEGHLDLSCVEPVTVKVSEIEALLLQPHDVLMTEGGDRDKLGRGCIWRGDIERCVFQNHIFRIRFKPDSYHPELFHFLLQAWQAKNYFYAHAKQTSNLCTINKRELRRFSVPKPRAGEQEEMLGLLKAAQANIEAVKAELEAVRRLKTSLLQNLLTGKVRVKLEGSVRMPGES